MNLHGKNIVVYDLEIKNPIDGVNVTWSTYEKMGISVGCLYDYRDDTTHVYMDDNLKVLVNRLSEPGTWIVAFNQIHFDNRLLRATCPGLPTDYQINNYDMLFESKTAAGLASDARVKGFKLDDHLRALSMPLKSADGSQAPIMYQEKRIGELVDYCLTDIRQERRLFEYIVQYGQIANAFRPKRYPIRVPSYFKNPSQEVAA